MESRIVGSTGRIYAIEPESNNFKLLKRNLELNRTDNVETFHQAISDRDGTSKLYISDSSNLHSMVPTANTSASETETVSVQTVDSFLAGKRPVQFLRMDIEGYEYEALKGMAETLRLSNLKMFIELHANILPRDKSLWILNELKSHGFSITTSISHDKFIQRALGRVRINQPTIDQLIHDPDLTSGRMGFLLFFDKHG